MNYQNLISLLEDFLVSHSQLVETEKVLMIPEVRCFLKSHEFLKTKDPDIFYSKMYETYYLMTREKLSREYLPFSPTWGISLNGICLIAKTLDCPKGERVFIRGYSRNRTSIREILHFRENCSKTMGLNPNKCKQLNNDKKRYQDGRIYAKDGLSIAMNARGNNGWYVIDDTKQIPCTQDDTFFAVTTRPRGMPFRKKQDNYVVYKDKSIRRLTPLECERLQGFPDNYTKYGVDGNIISDTQRYKCIGNAVSTNVITWITNNMFI